MTMASIGEEIADAIVLPGGGGGADNLQASESVSRPHACTTMRVK